MNTRVEYLKKQLEELKEEFKLCDYCDLELEQEIEEISEELNLYENGRLYNIRDQYYDRIFETSHPSNWVMLDLIAENPDINEYYIELALIG